MERGARSLPRMAHRRRIDRGRDDRDDLRVGGRPHRDPSRPYRAAHLDQRGSSDQALRAGERNCAAPPRASSVQAVARGSRCRFGDGGAQDGALVDRAGSAGDRRGIPARPVRRGRHRGREPGQGQLRRARFDLGRASSRCTAIAHDVRHLEPHVPSPQRWHVAAARQRSHADRVHAASQL